MDIQLYYEEAGEGDSLILLHGNGENGGYFVHQIEYFKEKYHVYVIDTRGHGKSPRGTAPFTITQFSEDLYAFMNLHGLERANILGFSDGGNIALLFALRHPERVKKLILNGANLDPKGVKASVQIPIIIGYKIASFFAKFNQKAKKNAEVLALMVNEPHIQVEELEELKVRTLVIAGTDDMIRDDHTKRIFKGIPDSELAIIPGDHFIANKNPAEFNRAVEKFLDT